MERGSLPVVFRLPGVLIFAVVDVYILLSALHRLYDQNSCSSFNLGIWSILNIISIHIIRFIWVDQCRLLGFYKTTTEHFQVRQ
eukprot:403376232